MSPYRVLVSRPGCQENEIMAAMLSVDRVTNSRNIFITQKAVPADPKEKMTSKIVAHLQTGKNNSIILDKYQIIKDYTHKNNYKVRHFIDGAFKILDEVELTQQDCLELAMKDYCTQKGIEIINTL